MKNFRIVLYAVPLFGRFGSWNIDLNCLY